MENGNGSGSGNGNGNGNGNGKPPFHMKKRCLGKPFTFSFSFQWLKTNSLAKMPEQITELITE